MRHFSKGLSVIALTLATTPVVSSAAVLFSDDFDVDATANWKFNSSIAGDTAATSDGKGAANFFFNYSTVGIPAAPGGTSTRGMIVQTNLPGTGVFSGASVSPLGLTLPAEYKLSAYVWQNTIGVFPGGGSGSTQMSNITVGTTGTSADFAGGTIKGQQFAISTDGNTNPDWRVYKGTSVLATSTGVYAAGTAANANDNLNSYYSIFSNGSNVQPPAAQTALYPNQTGNLLAGIPSFQWRLWEITKTATSITWSIDGTVIATVPASQFATFGGDNISFGMADINATSSTDANATALEFTLFDNVQVTSIPEPASLGLVGIGAAAMLGRRRRTA